MLLERVVDMKKQKDDKTKVTGIIGGISSAIGIAGLYNVCHTICQVLIAALAIFGITVVGMPLAFLQKYVIPFSIMGLLSSSIGIGMFYWTKAHCGMKKTKKDWLWFIVNVIVLMISITGIIGGLI